MVNALKFLWWNCHDFYHYDAVKAGKGVKSRWPISQHQYTEKCDRIDKALTEAFLQQGVPDVIALAEITKIAAEGLRDRLFPGYRVSSLDAAPMKPQISLALIFKSTLGTVKMVEQLPIVAERLASVARPMAVLDIIFPSHKTRLISCHWVSRMDADGSAQQREEMANFLSKYCYDYVAKDAKNRSVVLVGDFNDEPFDNSVKALHSHRHRLRASTPIHASDRKKFRLHLYNLSWRLLGERHAHDPAGANSHHSAGTYYYEAKKTWHSFDQILVSGRLLQTDIPYVDEVAVGVHASAAFLTDGLPKKFVWESGVGTGVSDHLPIFGKIIY